MAVWFVTGTSSGLGNALINELLESGHRVIATTRKSKAQALEDEITKAHGPETFDRVLVVELDLTKPGEVKTAFAAGLKKFGRIDVVVNNAGYAVLGEVEVCPIDEGRDQFEVMFWAPVHICKEAVRIFREENPAGEGGQIFNISSAGGYTAKPTLSYYNAAKFALEGFTEALRKEMTPAWKIQATIIEPGGFNTEWRGGNMTIHKPLPVYDTEGSPTKNFRSMLGTIPFIGSPEKGAKTLIKLSEKKMDLPLRVQLGSDALAVIRHTAEKTIADSKKWESFSHSTNVDGIDAIEYTKNLLIAMRGA